MTGLIYRVGESISKFAAKSRGDDVSEWYEDLSVQWSPFR